AEAGAPRDVALAHVSREPDGRHRVRVPASPLRPDLLRRPGDAPARAAARQGKRRIRGDRDRRGGRGVHRAPVPVLAAVLQALRGLRGGAVSEPAIEIEAIGKKFRRYRERPTSLKQRLTKFRVRSEEFWALKDVA